jgi:lysophospholipase L1-like esterase
MAIRLGFRRLAVYSLLVLVAALAIVEIAARCMVPPGLKYVGDEKYWVLTDHTNLFGRWDNAKLIPIQDYTATAREKLRAQRVICLGSSSTYGAGLEERELAFPGVLDRRLPDVEVINAGFSGYNSYQLYIYLAEVLVRLNPDAVVFYYGGNEGHGNSAKLFYPRAKQIAVRMRERGVTRWDKLDYAVRHGTANSRVLALYRLLDHSKAFLWWRDRVVTARIMSELVGRSLTPDAELLKIQPTTERILADMATLAADNKFTLIFAPEIASRLVYAAPPVWSAMQVLCNQRRAVCVDPLHAQPKLDAAALFLDTTHLNEAGNARLAETILPVLESVLVGDPASQ